MILGKVVGTVISTRKNSNLVGNKFLVVEPFEGYEVKGGSKIVAIDNVGSGVGDVVLVALGSAARVGCNTKDAPVDAAIVGIVDGY